MRLLFSSCVSMHDCNMLVQIQSNRKKLFNISSCLNGKYVNGKYVDDFTIFNVSLLVVCLLRWTLT